MSNAGEFSFTTNTPKGELSGTWKEATNGTVKFTFNLKKREFKYDPEIKFGRIDFLNPSVNSLQKEDLDNLLLDELSYLRNSVYARHGYAFTTDNARSMFEGNEKYMPLFTNVDKEMTSIEIQNIDLIKRYELKYSTKQSTGR